MLVEVYQISEINNYTERIFLAVKVYLFRYPCNMYYIHITTKGLDQKISNFFLQ